MVTCMASGTVGDTGDDFDWRGGCRWTENCIVYTRKFHKKGLKTSNSNKTAAATASTSGSAAASSAAISENPTTPPTTTQVPTTVASTSITEISASTSKVHKESATASLPRTNPGIGTTTSPCGNAWDDVVQEPYVARVTDNSDSSQQRVLEQLSHQELNLPRSLADTDVDYSIKLQQPQEQLQNQQHALASKDNSSILHLQTSDGDQNLRGLSPFSNENGLPGLQKSREVAAVQLTVRNGANNDGEITPVPPKVPSGNGSASVKPLVISKVDDRVRFKLVKAMPKDDIKELSKRLECEIDQVRRLVKQFEAKEVQLSSYNTQVSNSNLSNSGNYIVTEGGNVGGVRYNQPQLAQTDLVGRRKLVRVSSGVGLVGQREIRPAGLARVNSDVGATRNLESRPYSRQLSVSVIENNYKTGEFVEKEKRTPKANQYYRNSEFLLGKDRLPPESIKRLKTNNGRKHSGETGHAFRFGFGFDKSKNQVFKNCSSLLQKLMKHKHGWVFNEPVNAKALGLFDYHDVIKHPMDLGTVKSRILQNWYKSPREFAEDVRLVFRNAMTYNPKGQDVHIMAEQLLQVFEERWAIIETECNPYLKYQMYQHAGLPTPTSRKALPQPRFSPVSVSAPVQAPSNIPVPMAAAIPFNAPAAPQTRTLDRPEAMTVSMTVDPKVQRPYVGRKPVPKKPKAKDPNKRDMTYEEKQRLSRNLQSLPSEKLDTIIQIIKKRNTAHSQRDDEIEVDIDNVDTETLWELDRFVTNYKKSLSKNKRKAELALQARSAANQTVSVTNTTPAVADVQMESGTAFEKSNTLPAVQGEKGYNGRRSSSSSSSSTSESSSSDSDSDSSSADGSDAGHSHGT